MKKDVINRYRITDKGQIAIDISVQCVEDLYHDYERNLPYIKKDLDGELVDYLIESVKELRNHKFVICFSFSQMPDQQISERIKKSITTYYLYLKELEVRALKVIFKRSFILFAVGLVLLALAIKVAQQVSVSSGVLMEVFAQGLTVAAWVSLWEAIANIFLEWHPHRRNIMIYNKIIKADVEFYQTLP